MSSTTITAPVISARRHWTKVVTINVLLAAALGVAALAIGEAYLRLTIPSSSGDSIYESTKAEPYKVMKSDARIVSWGSELRTNRLGFRDDDTDIPARLPSEFRTIVLGDSFTVSAGVDYDLIYTSLLERRLEEQSPDAKVINLAVGGYNIIQYDVVLREIGLGLQPDLVLVAVFPFNDLSNDTYRANQADADGTSAPSSIRWYEHLYVYRAFLVKIESRVRSLLRKPEGAAPAPNDGTRALGEADARENLEALERLVDRAAGQGLEVRVVLLPNTDTFERQRSDFAAFVDLCETREWRCSNLLDRFIAEGVSPRSLRLNLLDGHPNEAYNALVARFIAEDLLPIAEPGQRRTLNRE